MTLRLRLGAGALLLVSLLGVVSCGSREEAKEPVDLLDESYVIFAPGNEEAMSSTVVFQEDARPALVASTPSEFRYRISVPARPYLTFAIGIANAPSASGNETLPGNRMVFRVRVGESQVEDVVFERDIHVARRGSWISQSVDLARYAGRELWISFETSFPGYQPLEGVAPLPVVGAFADPVLHDRGRHKRSRGAVIISIDTLRRDHTSLYGYPRKTTPGLEALAEDGILFEDAMSTSSWTLPAHASLLTSTLPSVHGATNLHVGLSPDWPNLATLAREGGFFTRAFVTHVYLSREYGLGEGFDRHSYLPETRAEEVTNRAVQFLEAYGDRDFFLFVHYYDPHWHYDPPEPYDRTFDPSYEGKATGVWWDFKELTRETIDPRDLHHIEALYDGEILYTDRQVTRLLREMKRLEVFDRSLVVVTSDHGEEFLDHGGWEHQKTLYEEQLRVPLIVKLPGGERGGERVARQVSLIDVAPTVTEILGIEPGPDFQGESLVTTEAGRAESWAETEHTLDGSHKFALRRGAGGDKAIFTLRQPDSEDSEAERDVELELFDLAEDPRELAPLEGAAIDASWTRALEAFIADARARREGHGPSPDVDLTPEDVERLRALDYIRE